MFSNQINAITSSITLRSCACTRGTRLSSGQPRVLPKSKNNGRRVGQYARNLFGRYRRARDGGGLGIRLRLPGGARRKAGPRGEQNRPLGEIEPAELAPPIDED